MFLGTINGSASGGGSCATGTFETDGTLNKEFTINTGLSSISKIILYKNTYAIKAIENSNALCIYDTSVSPKQSSLTAYNTGVNRYNVDGVGTVQAIGLAITYVQGGTIKYTAGNTNSTHAAMQGEWIAFP